MEVVRGPMLRIACLLLAVTAGCDLGVVGGGGTGTDGGAGNDADTAAAEAEYTAMILPIFGTAHTCASASCHGGASAPNLSSYAALKVSNSATGTYLKKPAMTASKIITGPLSLVGGMHSGVPYLTAAEMTTVAAFIDSH